MVPNRAKHHNERYKEQSFLFHIRIIGVFNKNMATEQEEPMQIGTAEGGGRYFIFIFVFNYITLRIFVDVHSQIPILVFWNSSWYKEISIFNKPLT